MQRLDRFLLLFKRYLTAMRRSRRHPTLLLALLALLMLSPTLANGAASTAPTSVTLTGTLLVIWGDSEPGLNVPATTSYRLLDDKGQLYELTFDPRLNDRLDRLYTKRITITGSIQAGLSQNGSSQPVVTVESLQAQTSVTPTVTGNHRFLSIMCKFSDVATAPRDQSFFQTQLGATKPGFNQYIQEMSYGTANLDNSLATGWVTLPQPRSFYVVGSNTDLGKLAQDCADASNRTDLRSFYGINFMFNDSLGCCAWGGAYNIVDTHGNNQYGFWYMTWMPYWGEGNRFGWRDHGVLAHEMSHAFGSPHSGSTVGYQYGSSWDVVSNPQAHCSGPVVDAIYGCVGQGSVTYNRDVMGFIPPGRKATYSAMQGSQTYTLDNLSQLTPTSANSKYMLVVPFITNSITHFYTIEARKQESYDLKLPLAHALIIHDVDTSRYTGGNPPVAYLYAPPGAAHDALRGPGGDPGTGDAAANWPVGQTLVDATNKVSITVVADVTTGFTVRVAPIDSPVVVKLGTDNNTQVTDSLSWALGQANTNANLNVITFQLPAGANNTVLVTGGPLPAVRSGLRIEGKDCSNLNSPRITLDGQGSALRLNLSAGNIGLSGLNIKGFIGPQILKVGSKPVTISCTTVSQS